MNQRTKITNKKNIANKKGTHIKNKNFKIKYASKKNYENSNIILSTNTRDSAIVFYKSEDIKKISELSGMINSNNEYQVHYIGLVMIQEHKDSSKELTIFPIAYYNYPQEVSSVTIDAEMSDVASKAKEIQEIACYAAKELIDELKAQFPNENLKFFISLFNNIHRHP